MISEQLAGFEIMTTNALHIEDLFAGNDAMTGSATGEVVAGPAPLESPPYDFLTGDGWITGTPSGTKANFGVRGGVRSGAFWGHLTYVDHGITPPLRVRATAVSGYAVDGDDPDHCRIICYDVTVNDVPGYNAWVRACDNGEPGHSDIFQIKLYSTSAPPPCGSGPHIPIYVAGGDLGGILPGGGNIQLHSAEKLNDPKEMDSSNAQHSFQAGLGC